MRKALEEIAFASLSANRVKYSEIHAKFATFWRAKDLLREIGQINPEFYPVPVQMLSDRVGESLTNFRFKPITDGFLTKADFVSLYHSSSKVLHTKNPYGAEDPTINIGYSLPEWIAGEPCVNQR